jgi:hypothetical protein
MLVSANIALIQIDHEMDRGHNHRLTREHASTNCTCTVDGWKSSRYLGLVFGLSTNDIVRDFAVYLPNEAA